VQIIVSKKIIANAFTLLNIFYRTLCFCETYLMFLHQIGEP
jgi:hypothetical protein